MNFIIVSKSLYQTVRFIIIENTDLNFIGKHQVQITAFRYTAGAIGGCGISNICEELIQRELWQNGPLSLAIDIHDTTSGKQVPCEKDDGSNSRLR